MTRSATATRSQPAAGSSGATSGSRSSFTPRDVSLLLALAAMWGCSFLFIKVAVATIPPLWLVSFRSLIGAGLLLLILRIRGTRLPRGVAIWRDLTLLAALGNAVPWGLMAWATQHLPSGLVAVMNALTPTMTMLIAISFGLERPAVRRFVGLAIALCGTAVAVSGDLGAPGTALAVGAVALGTLAYGAGAVYAKERVSGRQPPLAIATGQVSIGALLTLPLASLTSPMPTLATVPLEAVAATVALGALGTGLAFLTFYALIQGVGATSATMVTYLIPVVALVVGAVVLGEALTVVVLAGAALTVGGVWLAQRERVRTPVGQLTEAPR